MRIKDGNLFEGMRIVLPEHRELMEKMEKEQSKRKPPVLSEDNLREMHYILSEAIESGAPIRITLFHSEKDVVIAGVPVLSNGGICLQTEAGIRQVPLKQAVKIERL